MNELLKKLCEIHSPSGEEFRMKEFILNYVDENSNRWKTRPTVLHGQHFQDCVVLLFGRPQVAAFAHMDTTGFTVRYFDQLIPIGSPEVSGKEILTGRDSLGPIECRLMLDTENQLHYRFGRAIEAGTSLVYKSSFHEEKTIIRSPYLDNRIGIYLLLRLAETLENGALVFSCWEEHGGGSVPFLVKFLYETHGIDKMLVADVTWPSDGVWPGKGVVISYRDRHIPRKRFIEKITKIAMSNNIRYQTEVEAHGSSDGREIQQSPYPVDWCFVGPPVLHAHTDHEEITISDLHSSLDFYKVLMRHL